MPEGFSRLVLQTPFCGKGMAEPMDYASAGVDIDLEGSAVASLIASLGRSTRQPGTPGAPDDGHQGSDRNMDELDEVSAEMEVQRLENESVMKEQIDLVDRGEIFSIFLGSGHEIEGRRENIVAAFIADCVDCKAARCDQALNGELRDTPITGVPAFTKYENDAEMFEESIRYWFDLMDKTTKEVLSGIRKGDA